MSSFQNGIEGINGQNTVWTHFHCKHPNAEMKQSGLPIWNSFENFEVLDLCLLQLTGKAAESYFSQKHLPSFISLGRFSLTTWGLHWQNLGATSKPASAWGRKLAGILVRNPCRCFLQMSHHGRWDSTVCDDKSNARKTNYNSYEAAELEMNPVFFCSDLCSFIHSGGWSSRILLHWTNSQNNSKSLPHADH